jgi:hypothetical protein
MGKIGKEAVRALLLTRDWSQQTYLESPFLPIFAELRMQG